MASLTLPPARPTLRQGYGDATAGSHVSVQIMEAARRKREAEEAEAKRKADIDAAQETRAEEALKLSQNADARAAAAAKLAQEQEKREAAAGLRAQEEAVTKRAPGDLALEVAAYDLIPESTGKPFAQQPRYTKQTLTDKYGAAAATGWDEAMRNYTGDKTLGKTPAPAPQPGQTVHQDEKGNVSTTSTYVPKETPNTGATGESALEGLTPDEANMVRQIANYELPATVLSRIPGAQKMRILARVDQFDPTFNATEYPARQSLRTSVKSGVISQNIAAANTAVAHLNTLLEKAAKLDNSSFTPWNAVANQTAKVFGADEMTNFNNAANAVVSELAKVFKGAGVVPQQELNHWRENLSPNMSPEQIKGAVQTALELMGGRFAAIEDTYARGMGKPKDFTILNNKSRAILRKNGYDPEHLEGATTGQVADEAAPPQSAEPSQSPAAQYVPPKPGEVRNGYRYKGGVASDPTSWEKVQ